MKRHTRRTARARGFTLVELLFATTAGLIVSAAAFLLARNASAVFQEETRITAAQLSATLGLQRLATDIGRAGFLSTPNIATDPFVCNESGTWPALISGLRAVRLEAQGSVAAHPDDLKQSISNNLYPDRITVAGSFDSAEIFPVRTIEVGGGGKIVHLETLNLPIARTCKGKQLAVCEPDLQRVFKSGRILRILTPSGRQIFGLIDHLEVSDKIKVWLQPTPTVPTVAVNPRGYEGDCNFCLANVISVVRYELQSMAADPSYAALVAPVAGDPTGDAGRTELVRSELDKDGNPVIGSTELVAEYAVDLKFGISTVDQLTTAVTDFPIQYPENPAVYATLPERIRSVHVRFSTRARAPDRDVDLPVGPDGRKHRFMIKIGNTAAYARMRTLYTEIALQNLVRATW
jgi:type II secretory pathway pseudopilin PulG